MIDFPAHTFKTIEPLIKVAVNQETKSPVVLKTCRTCSAIKPATTEFFTRRALSADGLHLYCKDCSRAAVKASYLANIEKNRERNRNWHKDNPEKSHDMRAKWKKENPDRFRTEKAIAWRKKNRLQRLSESQIFAAKEKIRGLIGQRLRKLGYTKKSRTHEILGCDYDFFVRHIELQFLKGMSWENRSEWHIDHITPTASANTEDEVLALNHFTNLRPMWAKENIGKGAQITHLI